MKKIHFVTALATLIACACSSKQEVSQQANDTGTIQFQPGDSTVYGLACEGCTDTILVLLPLTGEDPDTFNILEATRHRQVFGRPRIGDKIAMVLNNTARHVADIVIDIEQLKGSWCYLAKPVLRSRASIDSAEQQILVASLPDSVRRRLLQPVEYGIQLKSDYVAQSIGRRRGQASEKNSPVIYPHLKHYREWRIFNGRLIFNETSRDTSGTTKVTSSDTAQFVLLRRDSLILQFADGNHSYYRKKE